MSDINASSSDPKSGLPLGNRSRYTINVQKLNPQYSDQCGRCKAPNSIGHGAYFCKKCMMGLIPKIYPCLECGREGSTSSENRICKDCRKLEQ